MVNIFKATSGASEHSQTGQHKNVKIDSLDHFGQGVSVDHRPVMFVEGALPGERVRVHITDSKSRVCQAQLLDIEQASEFRTQPGCQYFHSCGGCQTQHCDSSKILDYKRSAIDSLIKHTVVPLKHTQPKGLTSARKRLAQKATTIGDLIAELPWCESITGDAFGYRRKTRLSVDARNAEQVLIGFRAKQDSKIIDIDSCPVMVEPIQQLIGPIKQLVQSLRNAAAIGHIALFSATDFVQVCIRLVKQLSDADRYKLTEFALLHSCQMILEGNEKQYEYLTRKDDSAEYTPTDGIRLSLMPDDFVQVNHQVNQHMIAQAIRWLELKPDDRVLDLYCGIGNFSLPMAKQCQQVLGIEGSSKMVQRGQQNALKNGIENVQFKQADLTIKSEADLKKLGSFSKVLLDPARDGAAEVVAQLGKFGASRILYVSCNPATFARDTAKLLGQKFKLEKIALMDMFPQTAHSELMALFVPKSKSSERR